MYYMFSSCIHLILTHDQPTLPCKREACSLGGLYAVSPSLGCICSAVSKMSYVRESCLYSCTAVLSGNSHVTEDGLDSPLPHFLCVPCRASQGTMEVGSEGCTRDFWPRSQLQEVCKGLFLTWAQKTYSPVYGRDLGCFLRMPHWLSLEKKKTTKNNKLLVMWSHVHLLR